MLNGHPVKYLHPAVPPALPDRVPGSGKIRIGKRSHGNGDQARKSFRLEINSRATNRAEPEDQRPAAVGHAREGGRVARDASHLVPLEPGLIAEHGSGSPLTLKTVAR